MKWLDDHTDDVERDRNLWEAFAETHNGTCRLIRSHDHVYNRLLLTIPRQGYEVAFEACDLRCWQASASGRAGMVRPFGVSPRTLADDLLRLFHPEAATFEDSGLAQRLVISGDGATPARSILEGADCQPAIAALGTFNLVLQCSEGLFTLKLVPDPIHPFKDTGGTVLKLLDDLVSHSRAAALIT